MISEKITAQDLCFYGIDASSERNEYKEKYIDLFLELAHFKMQDFLDGKRFLIKGNKGTGKSAILNYIYQNNKNAKLLYFDEMTNNSTMGDFSRLQHIDYKTYYQKEPRSISKAWELFIIKTIIYECYKNESIDLFVRDEKFYELYKLLYSMYDVLDDNILPTCRRGNFYTQTICDIYFNTFNTNNTLINNRDYVYEILRRFYKLDINPDASKFYILFDELNFTGQIESEITKQKRMIAELVLTINYLYRKFASINLNVIIISSLRNEVQHIIGLELNKIFTDRGIEIDWNMYQADTRNPLISLMLKRFKNSYKDKENVNDEDIKTSWFPTYSSFAIVARDILKHTWGKPRDIISLFVKLKNIFPNAESIDRHMLNEVYKYYAHDAWLEISESLKTSYPTIDIHKIETLIPNLPNRFDLKDFMKIFTCVMNDIEVDINEAFEYIRILYEFGIIGVEENKEVYYYYRGYCNGLHQNSICVLHPTMQLGKKLI